MKKLGFNDNKNIIHSKLRTIRKQRGLTQEELAAKMQTLGVTIDQQMISKIEQNTRIVTDYELACFCRVLGVAEKDLLSNTFQNE